MGRIYGTNLGVAFEPKVTTDDDRPLGLHDLGRAYARGVPMGGDLTDAPSGKAPTFMVRALRDPDGANLDRIQGHQRLVGRRRRDAGAHLRRGRLRRPQDRRRRSLQDPPVGTTVEVADASYTNSIGDALLMGFWKDPDFDPGERAFYYVRVIEIPTPRWTAYDTKHLGVELPDEVPMTVQDRGPIPRRSGTRRNKEERHEDVHP